MTSSHVVSLRDEYTNVRARLKQGIYSPPDSEWIEEFKKVNEGRMPIAPEWWWAFESVREFYGIADSKEGCVEMGPKMDEVYELYAALIDPNRERRQR